MDAILTNNHYTVLRELCSKPRSISQLTETVRFTCHDSRVRQILFDLLDADLVVWRSYGKWELTPTGHREVHCDDAA